MSRGGESKTTFETESFHYFSRPIFQTDKYTRTNAQSRNTTALNNKTEVFQIQLNSAFETINFKPVAFEKIVIKFNLERVSCQKKKVARLCSMYQSLHDESTILSVGRDAWPVAIPAPRIYRVGLKSKRPRSLEPSFNFTERSNRNDQI